MRGHTVNLVIRGHHADRTGFANNVAKWVQERFAQHALRNISGRAVLSRLRLPVCGKMFQRRYDAFLVLERAIALESKDRSNSQSGVQIGILSIGFLDASPTWVARNVHYRREGL